MVGKELTRQKTKDKDKRSNYETPYKDCITLVGQNFFWGFLVGLCILFNINLRYRMLTCV